MSKLFHRQRMVQWHKYDFEGNNDDLGAEAAKLVHGYNIPTELLDLYDELKFPFSLTCLDDPTTQLMEDIETLKQVHEIIYPGKAKKLLARFDALEKQGLDACTIFRDREGNSSRIRCDAWTELEESVMATTYEILTFDRLLKLFKRARKLEGYLKAAIPEETPSSRVQILEMVRLKQPDSLQVDKASTLIGDDSMSINGSIMSGSSATWDDGMSTIIGGLDRLEFTDETSKKASAEFQQAYAQFGTVVDAFKLYIRLHGFRLRRIGGKKLGTVFREDHWQCLFYDLAEDQKKNGVAPQSLLVFSRLIDLFARLEALGEYGWKILERSNDDDLKLLGNQLWLLSLAVLK